MRRIAWLATLALCTALVACSQDALMKKFADPAAVAKAEGYVDLLKQANFAAIENDLDPSVDRQKSHDGLNKMYAMFPGPSFTSVKTVGYHSIHNDSDLTTDVTLEYEYPDRWVFVDVTTKQTDGTTTLFGFHAQTSTQSLEQINAFRLTGKNPFQYLVFTMGLISMAFSLYAFVRCIRTKGLARKWLWAICTLVGFGSIAVNWSDGQWFFRVISISIPCLTASHPLYMPWIVTAYLPLGAIFFLSSRHTMRVNGEITDEPPTALPEAPVPTDLNPPEVPLT